MSLEDRRKWDERYRQGDLPRELGLGWLDELIEETPGRGAALDVAAGTGRASLWMARRGLEVTAVDVSPVGLDIVARGAAAAGVRVATMELDLDAGELPPGAYSMISCMRFLRRELFPVLQARLAPGGVLALEMVNRRNLERHERPPLGYLIEPGETLEQLAGLEIVFYREGWQDGLSLARALARRPLA
jgi:2-polyprenyl-3-methyl-5-hydroxy-6-metoxy-1,4-benzoquinol methylase